MGETQAADRDGRIANDGLLEIWTSRHGEHWLVEVGGELDLANVATLDTELRRLNGDPVHLDLSRLDFMDSSGIALLLRATTSTQSQRGELTVKPGTGQPAGLLRLCGIDALVQRLA